MNPHGLSAHFLGLFEYWVSAWASWSLWALWSMSLVTSTWEPPTCVLTQALQALTGATEFVLFSTLSFQWIVVLSSNCRYGFDSFKYSFVWHGEQKVNVSLQTVKHRSAVQNTVADRLNSVCNLYIRQDWKDLCFAEDQSVIFLPDYRACWFSAGITWFTCFSSFLKTNGKIKENIIVADYFYLLFLSGIGTKTAVFSLWNFAMSTYILYNLAWGDTNFAIWFCFSLTSQ